MFEREIKFIYDFNLNKVKKSGSFLTYEQLRAADLHPAIMQYISAEIDFLIFEDRQKMLKNSVFDYSGGKITHYFKLISQEVKKSKRFSSEYISKLILHASSFTVNFLIRPKWSLLKFIFEDDEHKTAVEIKQILNYLYYYGYLKNILISYLDKKKILSMNKDEFSELLDKIEKLGVETYLEDVINTSLKSMAEFFSIGTTQKNRVPLPGIQIFLKEKKLTGHLNSLEENFGSDEKVNYELKDIQKVLLGIRTDNTDEFEELDEEEIIDSQTNLSNEIVETEDSDTAEDIFDSQDIEDSSDSDNIIQTDDENALNDVTRDEEKDEVTDEVMDEQVDEKDDIKDEIDLDEDLQSGQEISDSEIADETEISEPIEEEMTNKQEVAEDVTDADELVEQTDAGDFIVDESETEIEDTNVIRDDENEIIIDNDSDESEKMTGDETVQSLEEILDENIESEKLEDIDAVDDDSEFEESVSEVELNEVDEPSEDETAEEPITENVADEYKTENVDLSEEEFGDESEDPIADDNSEDDEPMLFGEDQLNQDDNQEIQKEEILEQAEETNEEVSGSTLIDMSEILEHKNMTKIIENIFDYDMEDFANTIDMISECPTKEEALALINDIFENNSIKPNSKEAETFKSIISEYFEKAD